jgi:hypothetical protein
MPGDEARFLKRSIQMKMQSKRQGERGVALLLSIVALLLVTSIGLGMMYLTDTETAVNSNYRDEQLAYYAAKAGLEEARDRMRSDAGAPSINGSLPTALPGAASGVLYVTNPANGETVAPWNSSNTYFDDEICKEVNCSGGQVPPTTGWYTTLSASSAYAASPVMPYKWIRVALKVNKSAAGSANIMYVNGSSDPTTANYQACWNGTNEIASSIGCAWSTLNLPVYMVTAFAMTPSGTRRMVQSEITQTKAANVPVQAALFSQNSVNVEDALRVTGNTDPVCASPNVAGAESGTSTVTTHDGNVTGSPATRNNAGWPYNMSTLISTLQAVATTLPATGTGVTGTGTGGTSPPFSGPHAVLGTAPTVTYDGSRAISSISNAGTPQIYYAPGDLTLGTSTVGGAAVTGQGVLIVNGNLTLNVTNGVNYFGLILVSGNISMTAASDANVDSHIHGAIVNAGTFSASFSEVEGRISVHQDACLVQSGLTRTDFRLISLRELMY